jgi:pilus assembly protein CpaE
MKRKTLKVSVLFGTGMENPAIPELLATFAHLKLLKQARDPETFLSQHQDLDPDLILVDLNGFKEIPGWLQEVITKMPRSEIAVCSQSRDPDFLIRIMKMRIGSFIPLPLTREEIEAVLERVLAERQRQEETSGRGQLVVVSGTKGGVGVTTVATNLGVALAEKVPGGVVLVDLARPFPEVGQFLDLKGANTIEDLIRHADSLDPLFIQKVVQQHKSKLGVILNNPSFDTELQALPDVRAVSKIFSTLREAYDWVVADLGFWPDLLFIKMLQEADQVLLLTELSVPDLQNMKKMRGLFQRWEVDEDRVRVVVNRFRKDYTLGLQDLNNIFPSPKLFTLPSDYGSLIEAINQGVPLSEVAANSKLWRKLKDLSAEVIALSNPQGIKGKPGLLRRLLFQ